MMMMTMMLGELHLKKMEDEEEAMSTPSLKVRIRRKHSKRSATETLLDYIEKGKKKKEISFDLVTGAKKKQRNRKRVNSEEAYSGGEEASSQFDGLQEDLFRSSFRANEGVSHVSQCYPPGT